MADERRLDVLRAIVEDYVHTREPVGSKALAERHRLGVSPATIRNDMAVLEEEGLIAQPHTSAGRVPTDKGYRVFVDRLSEIKPLSAAERRAISALLDQAVDLDDVLDRTVRLLAQLTRQVAMVQYPRLSRSTVRHVEVVGLGNGRVLIVLITSAGRVEQRLAVLTREPDEDFLAEVRTRLNALAAGRRLGEVRDGLPAFRESFPEPVRPLLGPICEVVEDLAAADREERLVLAGTANLARVGGDFPQSISPVLEAIEEQVVLLRLLSEIAEDSWGVGVRIGQENVHEGLSGTAVVATGYGSGGSELARLGVLGPTRMDYPTTMATVRAVARYVSRILAG